MANETGAGSTGNGRNGAAANTAAEKAENVTAERARSGAAGAEPAEVLVIGAGPAGLTVAGDLAEAGVRVRLLERRSKRDVTLTRAFAVHARTLEQLDARGLAEEVLATGHTVQRFRIFNTLDVDLSGLPTRFPFVLVTPQYHVEEALERRARAAGAEILRGQEVVALRQTDGGVEVDVRDREGAESTHRARYLVGADGVRSTVRQQIGMIFPGESVLRSVMLADVRLERTPPELLTVNANPDGFAFVVPYGDGWYRAIVWNRHAPALADSEPVELAELRSVMSRVLGVDYGPHDARWISRFHSDERQAPQYRDGRVLLVGDAAHVHSPAGGMGMNTGIQDAANLGWKLAAVVRGRADESLLDTYQAERHPVGRMVLRTSGAIVRAALAMGGPVRSRLLRRTLLPAVQHIPLFSRVGARRISGVGIGYAAPRGSHRLTGRRVPDLRLAGGGRLYEALRGGHFVLVAPEGAVPGRRAAEPGGPLRVAAPEGSLRTVLLVRPDGYAAWAADGPSEADVERALREHGL